MGLYPAIEQFLAKAELRFEKIEKERKHLLESLGGYVASRATQGHRAGILFVCTHNSRRSLLSQLWAYAAGWKYMSALAPVAYSGGTEATALYPLAVDAARQQGWDVEIGSGQNPQHTFHCGVHIPPIHAFSKRINHPSNPLSHFAAVITCAEADQACPLVPGADLRIALPYLDPKQFDLSTNPLRGYLERSEHIAVEMAYAMRYAGTLIHKTQ